MIFSRKKDLHEAEEARLKLLMVELRLNQFHSLINELKKFDWFEFDEAGKIIAHKRDSYDLKILFTVPDPSLECEIKFF